MEILIAVGAAVLAGVVAWPARRKRGDGHHQDGRKQPRPPAADGGAPAQPATDAAEELVRLRERLEQELAERRAEIGRLEERTLQREESLERRLDDVDHRERALNERDLALARTSEALDRAGEEHVRALERVAGMSRTEAKHALVHE